MSIMTNNLCEKCELQPVVTESSVWHCIHTIKENIIEGDLVEIRRFGVPFQHWGVYVGSDEVVHFMGTANSKFGIIRIDKLGDCVGRSRFRVKNSALFGVAGSARTPAEICKYALDQVGKHRKYGAFTFNCEHFAKECRFGSEYASSDQVTQILQCRFSKRFTTFSFTEIFEDNTDNHFMQYFFLF